MEIKNSRQCEDVFNRLIKYLENDPLFVKNGAALNAISLLRHHLAALESRNWELIGMQGVAMVRGVFDLPGAEMIPQWWMDEYGATSRFIGKMRRNEIVEDD